MAEESTRRSGRANKGQHKNASSSPPPVPKPAKAAKATKPKSTKKSTEPEPEEQDDDGEEDEEVRCICGNSDPDDKRTFIGCDACSAWQHSVCMGMPDEEKDLPDHYFCEQCRPEEHPETMNALAKGEHIWDTRTKIWQSEKKSRSKKKKGDKGPMGWLKKDVPVESAADEEAEAEVEAPETGNKRKREEVKEEPEEDAKDESDQPKRGSRQDKRRKSTPQDGKDAADEDPETALVSIDKLPSERQKVAQALATIITEDVSKRPKSSFKIPSGQTAKSIGENQGSRIEYAMHMNYSGQEQYKTQFRALHANLKKNKLLVERLLHGSLTADELSQMESKDMASEELQRERAELKAELDRQTIAQTSEGPRIRRTHKGDEIIEDETHPVSEPVSNSAPVRERPSVAEEGGSPTGDQAGSPDATDRPPLAVNTGKDRRTSSQQFDMNNIWAKTAQSPTAGTPPTGTRPMQMPPRRRSSIQQRDEGAKHDADVDRMLEDNDEPYSPAEYSSADGVIWRGKLVQSSGEGEPTVNARFVAGRDLGSTLSWKDVIPQKLMIDGRLQIAKAEEYLCSLEYSKSSDVSVLALTPYDNADAFNAVFNYFQSRQRYAVVNKHTPAMVKDLYIIPIDVGASLPEHIGKLVHNTIKMPIEERVLLATFVVARAPAEMNMVQDGSHGTPQNGHQLPQHLRGSMMGPAGSPLNAQTPVFSPSNNPHNGAPVAGYGAPPPAFPPNPYGPPNGGAGFAPPPSANPLVNEILGPLQHTPTAQQILAADPNMERAQLVNLANILTEDEGARTNIETLAAKLFSKPT